MTKAKGVISKALFMAYLMITLSFSISLVFAEDITDNYGDFKNNVDNSDFDINVDETTFIDYKLAYDKDTRQLYGLYGDPNQFKIDLGNLEKETKFSIEEMEKTGEDTAKIKIRINNQVFTVESAEEIKYIEGGIIGLNGGKFESTKFKDDNKNEIDIQKDPKYDTETYIQYDTKTGEITSLRFIPSPKKKWKISWKGMFEGSGIKSLNYPTKITLKGKETWIGGPKRMAIIDEFYLLGKSNKNDIVSYDGNTLTAPRAVISFLDPDENIYHSIIGGKAVFIKEADNPIGLLDGSSSHYRYVKKKLFDDKIVKINGEDGKTVVVGKISGEEIHNLPIPKTHGTAYLSNKGVEEVIGDINIKLETIEREKEERERALTINHQSGSSKLSETPTEKGSEDTIPELELGPDAEVSVETEGVKVKSNKGIITAMVASTMVDLGTKVVQATIRGPNGENIVMNEGGVGATGTNGNGVEVGSETTAEKINNAVEDVAVEAEPSQPPTGQESIGAPLPETDPTPEPEEQEPTEEPSPQIEPETSQEITELRKQTQLLQNKVDECKTNHQCQKEQTINQATKTLAKVNKKNYNKLGFAALIISIILLIKQLNEY